VDREAQSSNAIYSGIDGTPLQDQAITESMGPVTDHVFEHLAPSDQMITRTRRRLLMLLRQRRQEPMAGALCEATVRRGASLAHPVAGG
jgi:hypothetical protein